LGAGGLFLRKLRAKVSDEPTGFVWVEKDKVAGSGYPSSRGQIEWLVARGIDSILTLTPRPLAKEWVGGLPLTLGHVPMQDHAAPEIDSLNRGVNFVREQVGAGKVVLVHCLAGEGRTGCVLAAYLMKEKSISAEEALRSLREIKPAFVERAQERALKDYESSLR
jgi:atypical dual specificity phosphatase